MKYKVDLASGNSETRPPCEGAVRKMLPYYHVRTCKTFEEYDKKFGKSEGLWLSKGSEHCLTDNGISRREGKRE